jgi:hypothetical protein
MEAQFNYHCYTHDGLNHKLLGIFFILGRKQKGSLKRDQAMSRRGAS